MGCSRVWGFGVLFKNLFTSGVELGEAGVEAQRSALEFTKGIWCEIAIPVVQVW